MVELEQLRRIVRFKRRVVIGQVGERVAVIHPSLRMFLFLTSIDVFVDRLCGVSRGTTDKRDNFLRKSGALGNTTAALTNCEFLDEEGRVTKFLSRKSVL